MNKKTIIIISVAVLVAVIFGVCGYLYWVSQKKSKAGANATQKAEEATQALIDSTLKGVLPSLGTNPLENKPDINPADKANPFNDIKTNPFE